METKRKARKYRVTGRYPDITGHPEAHNWMPVSSVLAFLERELPGTNFPSAKHTLTRMVRDREIEGKLRGRIRLTTPTEALKGFYAMDNSLSKFGGKLPTPAPKKRRTEAQTRLMNLLKGGPVAPTSTEVTRRLDEIEAKVDHLTSLLEPLTELLNG